MNRKQMHDKLDRLEDSLNRIKEDVSYLDNLVRDDDDVYCKLYFNIQDLYSSIELAKKNLDVIWGLV